MAFPQSVKDEALAACARRCCICKEYKGRNMEVHHILQRADGGEDSFDNAIPLCFDCHADAGHYNPRHPKGTKFSPDELRAHRDNWYKIVDQGRIPSSNKNITHQFFATNSFDIVWEIVSGDFSNFPINNVKLVQNELYDFLKSASKLKRHCGREEDIYFKSYDSIDDFLKHHPDATGFEDKWGCKYWEREASIQEIKDNISDKDFISNYLVRHAAKPEEIAKVHFSEHGCADSYYETFILRNAKVVFLAIINGGVEVLYGNEFIERFSDDGDFRVIGDSDPNPRNYNLNKIPLMEGECLLIPYALVLYPTDAPEIRYGNSIINKSVTTGQSQDARPIEISNVGMFQTIGPYHKVEQIKFLEGHQPISLDIKPLLMNNLLLISRYWNCGCCPHLFGRIRKTKKWLYIGELFYRSPSIVHDVSLNLKEGLLSILDKISIVEIEDEQTFLDSIKLDGVIIACNIELNKNDKFEIDIDDATLIEIKGQYNLFSDIAYKKSALIKNTKIENTISDLDSNFNLRF